MKLLLLLGSLLAALLQADARAIGVQGMPEGLQEIIEASSSCTLQLKLTPEDLPSMASPGNLYPEDNDKLNALSGCMFKTLGIINENSEVNQEKLENYFLNIVPAIDKTSSEFRKQMHDLAEGCKNIRGSDYGQTAVKLQNCAMHVTENDIRMKCCDFVL